MKDVIKKMTYKETKKTGKNKGTDSSTRMTKKRMNGVERMT
jgi:hypothetical protein